MSEKIEELNYIKDQPLPELIKFEDIRYVPNKLSKIAVDLGSITAGNITIDSSGFIQGGQTAYNTGTGFFLGYATDAYKFSLGNPAGNHLIWTGSELKIVGNINVKKIEYQNFYFSSQYESLDGWTQAKTGTDASIVATISFLDLRPGDEVDSYARISSEFGGQAIDWTNDDPIIEAVFAHTLTTFVIDAWFVVGRYANGTGNQMGFWWKRADQKLYAIWATGATGALQSYDLGITADQYHHKYRAEKVGASIKFYFDGVLKHTATTNLPSGGDDLILVLTAITKAAGTNELKSRRILLTKNT